MKKKNKAVLLVSPLDLYPLLTQADDPSSFKLTGNSSEMNRQYLEQRYLNERSQQRQNLPDLSYASRLQPTER